jgi:hypothetical protein
MSEYEKLVCVGGPCDGEWHEIRKDRPHVVIQVYTPPGVSWNFADSAQSFGGNVATHIYKRLSWETGYSFRDSILVPYTERSEFAFAALVRGYRKPHPTESWEDKGTLTALANYLADHLDDPRVPRTLRYLAWRLDLAKRDLLAAKAE